MLCVALYLLCGLCVKKKCNIILFLFLFFSSDSFSQNPVITSHRGAADFAPENTLLSVQKALEAGAKRIEIDVRLTCDTVLVLMHDKKLNRTTNCRGNVYRKKYPEIIDCNAGFDQKIPILADVLKLIDGKAMLVIDIKKGGTLFEKTLTDEIRKYNASSWCALTSFKIKVLKRIYLLDTSLAIHRSFIGKIPFIPVYFGTNVFVGGLKKYIFINEFNFNNMFITKHLVKKVHAMNRKINAWTVDKKKKCKKLQKKGVDGIITNNPLILQEE
ncbi:MAG: glycerophosphodiester phosphodiesterase [Bacteroidota bacterium]